MCFTLYYLFLRAGHIISNEKLTRPSRRFMPLGSMTPVTTDMNARPLAESRMVLRR